MDELRKCTPEERLERVSIGVGLPAPYQESYLPGRGLPLPEAATLIENVIGVQAFPVGLALNLLVNGRDYLVPMVIEESSVVAAVSYMGRITRRAGGIEASADPPIMIGQVQILECPDFEEAEARILDARDELIALANESIQAMVARGGGALGLEVHKRVYEEDGEQERMLVVHIHIDTREAMGANVTNQAVEYISPRLAALSRGRIGLRILSNLADRRLARAKVVLTPEHLTLRGFQGDDVIRGIVAADRFAVSDPYRAATHNKGIMNGIDAVALATGNDWRAIEAGAHAYAARSGQYRPLSRWKRLKDGRLEGTLEMPMQVGVVGGPIRCHPTVMANLHILGVKSAGELAGLMAAVGLAQNLAALRALATEGIQRGHMSRHARQVALTAGVPAEHVNTVAKEMARLDRISVEGALEAFAALERARPETLGTTPLVSRAKSPGKIILLGEHAVVHGYPALAAAVDLHVEVACLKRSGPVWLDAPQLFIHGPLFEGEPNPLQAAMRLIFERLKAPREGLSLRISGNLPPGKGLGSSAALAVAGLRAVAAALGRPLEREQLLEEAHKVEQIFHGMPSGIDHTVSALGGIIRFRRKQTPLWEALGVKAAVPIVLLDSGEVGPTSMQVGKVLSLMQQEPVRTRAAFEEIGQLVERGADALARGDMAVLATVMNRNHELLRDLGVSTPRLDELVSFALAHGALGAKLTGAGGGGMVLALCPDGVEKLREAAMARGLSVFATTFPAVFHDDC